MIMLPYFIEAFIKAREIPYILRNKKSFKPECFGKVLDDGSLEKPYKEIWSFTHVVIWFVKKIKGKCYENDVTIMLLAFQALWCTLLVLLFL